MEIVDCSLFLMVLPGLGAILNFLIVALGLGLVIFFHELGHFAVAKWCGVFVERFSIGLGHPIFTAKYGDTEYSLGWLPFGGYVKMLGQDDMDPGQMVDEQIAANPKAYSSKNVPQRMAIISAGVIMNIITGLMFFAIAFRSGVEMLDRTIGTVQVGMPAWQHGIRAGDQITRINGARVVDYGDIKRNTALSRGPITLEGNHADGTGFEIELQPIRAEITRIIGVAPSLSLQFRPAEREQQGPPLVLPHTAASGAALYPGDAIVEVDGQPVGSSLEFIDHLARHAAESVELTVRRAANKGEQPREERYRIPPEKVLSFGFKLRMGKVTAVRLNSVAAKAGIQPGDRIAKVDGLDVEVDLDPLRISEYFSERAGKEVKVLITREVPDGKPIESELTVVPENLPAWSEPPRLRTDPLSIPSLGLAFHLLPNVFDVTPGGPADATGIRQLDTITAVEFALPPGVEKDHLGPQSIKIPVKEGEFAYAFWELQTLARGRVVKLSLRPADNPNEVRTVEIQPQPADDWFVQSTRGINLPPLTMRRKADNLADSLPMAWKYTTNSITDIYLTLRGLFTRDISHKGLSGPIGIFSMAYHSSEAGLSTFVLFLGIISINLAVINFLPIPVLDGGHMMFLIWEGVTRNKPSEKVQIAATWVGICFLASLMLFVIYQDLFGNRGG